MPSVCQGPDKDLSPTILDYIAHSSRADRTSAISAPSGAVMAIKKPQPEGLPANVDAGSCLGLGAGELKCLPSPEILREALGSLAKAFEVRGKDRGS